MVLKKSQKLVPKEAIEKLIALMRDKEKSPEVRAHLMATQVMGEMQNPMQAIEFFTHFVKRLDQEQDNPDGAALKAKEDYEQKLKDLAEGPLRPGTFIKPAEGQFPGGHSLSMIVTPDGQTRYSALHPDVKAEELVAGQELYLDPQCAMVLGTGPLLSDVGQEALFVRRIPGTATVELQLRDEKMLFYASQILLDEIQNGVLKRQDPVLCCPQRRFAFVAVPKDEDRSHRFVDHTRVPDIDILRDMGAIHYSLGWLIRRTRLLMFRDDLLAKYNIRKRVSLLMVGGPGTGKTFTIKGFLRVFYDMIEERTGRGDVGSRVIRVKLSDLLSKWLGESDKNIDQLFDDIIAVAKTPVETADGEQVILPVTVIIEEADGIAAKRSGGTGHDGASGAMDRILTTILQRLDDPVDEIGHLPVILLSVTNFEAALDAGMVRRLGGKVARFYRLNREGFASVLDKKIHDGYPLAGNGGCPSDERRQQIIDEIVSSYWAPNGDDGGQVELTFADGSKELKYRRHFLTPALIEQAMSTSVDELAFQAEGDTEAADEIGLSAPLFIDSLNHHVDSIADTIRPQNAADFIDIPENVRIAQVRRLPPQHNRAGALLN